MLNTKSILEPKEEFDGLRISVMSRHVWGPEIITYTNLTEITSDMFDLWRRDLAPSEKLVGDYYKRHLSWGEFEKRYFSELREDPVAEKVKYWAYRSIDEIITFLCIEPSPERCHRRLLAEECKRYQPDLKLNIR